jgi:hypothetical protein
VLSSEVVALVSAVSLALTPEVGGVVSLVVVEAGPVGRSAVSLVGEVVSLVVPVLAVAGGVSPQWRVAAATRGRARARRIGG